VKRVAPARPVWYRTLGFRLGVVLGVTLVAFGVLGRPLYYKTLALLGLDVDRTLYVVAGAILSVLFAALVGFAIARWLTGRLTRLSRFAAEAARDDENAGTYEDNIGDEISVMAASLNLLLERMAEHRKEFHLHNIRRREWVAQISHDLRTPLTAQLACLDRARIMAGKPDSEMRRRELRELLAVAKADADRVHVLADDLLEIARLDSGDRLHLEPVPQGELVRQAVRRLEPLATQSEIRLELRITSRLPVLHADGRRLTRAIENLMRNAIQHARSSVEVIAMLSGARVRFEVRDDGRWLPKEPDFLAYLRRGSGEVRLAELSKRRRRGDSAGLGLVVAQRVAEAHGGIVDAYNLSKGGAAFCLDIPVPDEDNPLGEASAASV